MRPGKKKLAAFALASACIVRPVMEARNRVIESIATGLYADWASSLGQLAHRHRIDALVRDVLSGGEPLLRSGMKEIGHCAAEQARESLTLAAESVRLRRGFVAADLPVLFVKGAALAMLAFGNVALRHSKDIDLLVPRVRLAQACRVLEEAGYRRTDPPPGTGDAQLALLTGLRRDFVYFNDGNGVQVELHWRLFANPHFVTEPSAEDGGREVELSRGVSLPTLRDDDLFAYLCGHGALHWWARLKWLADIGALLSGKSHAEIERLYAAAQARGAERPGAQALMLCERLLKSDIPPALIARFRRDPILRWLESTALQAMTAGEGSEQHELRFGTTRGSLSTILLGKGWRYKLAEIRLQLTSERDVRELPLPARWQFLYPALRLPLWLWRKAMRTNA